jgi:hypothetical protein
LASTAARAGIENTLDCRAPRKGRIACSGPRPEPWILSGRPMGMSTAITADGPVSSTRSEKRSWICTCGRVSPGFRITAIQPAGIHRRRQARFRTGKFRSRLLAACHRHHPAHVDHGHRRPRLCASVSSVSSSAPRRAKSGPEFRTRYAVAICRAFSSSPFQQARQKSRRHQIAQPVRRIGDQPVFGHRDWPPLTSRLPVLPAIIAGAEVTSTRAGPSVSAAAVIEPNHQIGTGQPRKLMHVRRRDIGDRNQALMQSPWPPLRGHRARRHRR